MIFNFIGNYSVIISLFLSFAIFFKTIFRLKNLNELKKIDLKKLIFFQFFFILVSFICLLILFINSEFSNITVYYNSHTTKPFFYKVSGLWGNHEGSLLLWLLILTFINFLFLIDFCDAHSMMQIYLSKYIRCFKPCNQEITRN